MNSHGNFTKTGIDFPLISHQNLLITNEHLIMTRKLTLQQRVFIVSESKDTPSSALIQLFIAKFLESLPLLGKPSSTSRRNLEYMELSLTDKRTHLVHHLRE